jgi:hypothetical protein
MVAGGDLVSDYVEYTGMAVLDSSEPIRLEPLSHPHEQGYSVSPKYDIIYADPTWDYKTWSEKGAGRSAKQHYKITPLEELKQLDVNQYLPWS